MATTPRAVSTNSGTSTTPSVASPSGLVEGDLLIIVVHCNNRPTFADNNSPDAMDKDEDEGGGGDNHAAAIFSRRIEAGDPSTWNFTLGSSQPWNVVAIAWQDPHVSVIYDVVSSNANGEGASTLTADDITTINDEAIHSPVACMDGSGSSITGVPSGYNEEVDTGSGYPISIATKVITPAGATGAQDFTSGDSHNWATFSFALRDEGIVTELAARSLIVGRAVQHASLY